MFARGSIAIGSLLIFRVQDISILQGLGIKFVIVPGTNVQTGIWGSEPRYVGSYRVTHSGSLCAAMDAAGRILIQIEAKLFPGPCVGFIEGVDYGSTGAVKKIEVASLPDQQEQVEQMEQEVSEIQQSLTN